MSMSLLGDSRPGRTAGDVPGSGRMDGEGGDRDGVRIKMVETRGVEGWISELLGS